MAVRVGGGGGVEKRGEAVGTFFTSWAWMHDGVVSSGK